MGGAELFRIGFLAATALACTVMSSPSKASEFAFPAACTLGEDCFVQMLPDIDPGPNAIDPFCRSATRDGYPGTDIRLRSMAEMRRGVDVYAMADGTVIEARDGMTDRLVRSRQNVAVVDGRECGNGVAIDHGDGVVAHYCHMREASLAAKPGDRLSRGQKIGEIGASGLAHYPKLHVAVLRDGKVTDPFSGLSAGENCIDDQEQAKPLFDRGALQKAGLGKARLLESGLTDANTASDEMSDDSSPFVGAGRPDAFIAWGKYINLRRGDRVRLTLYGPSGGVVAAKTTLPAAKPKREIAVYAGRRGKPVPGSYRVVIELLRNGKVAKSSDQSIDIAG